RGLVNGLGLVAPRQVRRVAVELLVPPVADAADPLREQEARGRGVHERGAADARPADDDDRGDRPEEDPAPDPEAAMPDLEDALPLRRRHLVPRGEVVVEARADDAEADGPDGDPDDEVGVPTRTLPPAAREPERGEDGDEERQAVEVDRERPDVDDPARRRGDVRDRCDHRRGFCRLIDTPNRKTATL